MRITKVSASSEAHLGLIGSWPPTVGQLDGESSVGPGLRSLSWRFQEYVVFEDCDEDPAFVKRLVQGVTTCWILLKHLVPFVIGRYKKVGEPAQGALTLLDVLGSWLLVWLDGTCALTVSQLAAIGSNFGASFSNYDRSGATRARAAR
jgi:hypothetical protein